MIVHDRSASQVHERSLELAAGALDFELTRAETAELEAHVAGCPVCTRRAAAIRADALALGRPLVLLPSARIDTAIATEIARRRAGPQRLVLVAAAALLVLALLGAAAIGAYLLRTQERLPTTVVPPTIPSAVPVAVASPDRSPSPTVPLAPPGETWDTIDFAPASGGSIEAVTFDGANLVGVGRGGCLPDFNNPTDCYGAAWTSAGGAPWVRAADHPGLAVGLEVPTSGPEKGIFDVVAGPAGIVAVGHQYAGVGPGIWRSTDGQRWQQVSIGSNVVDDFFGAIVAYPEGYVIVGRAVDYRALTARAAAWVSTDGVSWTRAVDTAEMDVGACIDTLEEPTCGGMLGITWTGSRFVAVGETRTGVDGQPPQLAAWTSEDGMTWTRSTQGLGFGDEAVNIGGYLSGVTAGGPGVVAVGTICRPDCAVREGVSATSRDGSIWTVTPIDGAIGLGDVASAGGFTYAVGVAASPAPPAVLQLWRSNDGVAWRRLSDPPAVADGTSIMGLDIASTGDRIVIAGWTDNRSDDGVTCFAYLSPSAATTSQAPTETSLPTATASPRATASAGGSAATSVDPAVLLRVDITPDVSVGRMPSLTVYRDGTVLRRNDASGSITRLTSEGLDLLMAAASDDRLFGASGSIGPDPAYAGGFTGYTVAVRRGDEVIVRSTTNKPAESARVEAESIVALAEHLDDLDAWLPQDAWATGADGAAPYVASDYLLKVTVFKQAGVDYPPQALDRADVHWPLSGSLEGFGDAAEDQPLGPGTTSRCGLLTLAEAVAVQDALAAAPFNGVAENRQAELDWAPSIGHVTVTLVPLLPDDPRDCSVDRSWP